MWPGEREVVAVWADELQARGDRLGDVIALHLRAEQIDVDPEHEHASERSDIARAAEALRLDSIEHLLGPAIGELPRLRLRWQLGLVRGIYLDTNAGAHPPAQLVLEVVGKLLRRPALRFLDDLQLEAVVPDTGIERALLEELGSRDVVARPRRIVLGTMPRTFRRQRSMRRLARLSLPAELLESAIDRGLIWYGIWGQVQPLPWAPGDGGSRVQQLDRLLDRSPKEVQPDRLAASLWDTSLKVRRRTFDALPAMPDALARALPSVLALDLHGARVFGDIARRCAERIVEERPHWVSSVADNFTSYEPWVAMWLAELEHPHLGRRAIPRIRAMIRRLESSSDFRPFDSGRLQLALQRFGEPYSQASLDPSDPNDEETIAELLTKLGRHREL